MIHRKTGSDGAKGLEPESYQILAGSIMTAGHTGPTREAWGLHVVPVPSLVGGVRWEGTVREEQLSLGLQGLQSLVDFVGQV